MLIGLHDAERDYNKTKSFPNLALMKISAYHKAQGNTVEWWNPLNNQNYDVVYSSKVFTFTPENPYLPMNTIKYKYSVYYECCFDKLEIHTTVICQTIFTPYFSTREFAQECIEVFGERLVELIRRGADFE